MPDLFLAICLHLVDYFILIVLLEYYRGDYSTTVDSLYGVTHAEVMLHHKGNVRQTNTNKQSHCVIGYKRGSRSVDLVVTFVNDLCFSK